MTEPAYEALVRRNRELEALNAVSATIGRGADLETTAGDALDVVLELTGMRVGCIFRKEATADELVLVAHRGLQASDAALLGLRPLHGTPGRGRGAHRPGGYRAPRLAAVGQRRAAGDGGADSHPHPDHLAHPPQERNLGRDGADGTGRARLRRGGSAGPRSGRGADRARGGARRPPHRVAGQEPAAGGAARDRGAHFRPARRGRAPGGGGGVGAAPHRERHRRRLSPRGQRPPPARAGRRTTPGIAAC